MPTDPILPHKIAVLCDLRDDQGRILLLHRAKDPNKGLFSPIGGKLETSTGESPMQCAQREILEEAGIHIPIDKLQLIGIISEKAYEGQTHWLLFIFHALKPVEVNAGPMDEGTLDWHHPDTIASLPVPESDRLVLWPMIQKWTTGVDCIHIDCTGESMTWTIEQ